MTPSRSIMTCVAVVLGAIGALAACALPNGAGGVDELTASSEEALVRAQPLTPEKVSEVVRALEGANPSDYRITLPVYRGDVIVGQRTYGTLALSEVREVANRDGLAFTPTGNVQGLRRIEGGNESGGGQGGGGGGNTGNGPNSHYTTSTFSFERLREVLRTLDARTIVFVDGARRQ